MVDDDVAYLRSISRTLRRVPNIELRVFESVRPSLAYLQDNAADIVVLDYLLPDINGIDGCRRVKAISNVEVVLVSGHVSPEMKQAATDAGATRVLQKPCEVAAVLDGTFSNTGTSEALSSEHIEVARRIARSLARRYGSLIPAVDLDGLAMLGLCEAAQRYNPTQEGPFLAFAATRVRGAVFDELRRVKRRNQIASSPPAPGDEDSDVEQLPSAALPIDEEVDEMWRRAELRGALEELPSDLASLLELRFERGLSITAIATTVGLSVATVTTRLERGFRELRKIMKRREAAARR